MTETVGQRKFVGAVWIIAGVLGLIAAFLVQPLADWGFFGWIIGALVGVLAIVGLWMVVTGKGRIIGGSMSVKAQRTFAIVGIVAVTVIVVSYLLADWANWTALDVLTIAVWVALGAMFIVSFMVTNRALKGS